MHLIREETEIPKRCHFYAHPVLCAGCNCRVDSAYTCWV